MARAHKLCAAHYKQWRRTGKTHPFWPKRKPRQDTIRFAGVSLKVECAVKLNRHADEHGRSVQHVMADILEAWADQQPD